MRAACVSKLTNHPRERGQSTDISIDDLVYQIIDGNVIKRKKGPALIAIIQHAAFYCSLKCGTL